LLDTAAALIDRGGAELHHMEGIEHSDGVFEVVIDRALVALERVQRGDLHALPERLATRRQPVGVGRPSAARDQVEQPGADASALVTGQVDHPGELLRATAARADGLGRDVVPDVFIDAQGW
jgi:hypothetical protein